MWFPFGGKCMDTTAITKKNDEDDSSLDLDQMGWLNWMYAMISLPPSDILLFYNEKIELIDWDNKIKTLAEPMGHLLTIITFIIRFLQDNIIKPNYMKIYEDYRLETLFDFNKSDTLKKYKLFSEDSNNDLPSVNDKYVIKMKNYRTNTTWYYMMLKYMDKLLQMFIIVILFVNLWISYQFCFGYYKYYSLYYTRHINKTSSNIIKRPLEILNSTKNYHEILSNSSILTMIKYYIFRNKSAIYTQDIELDESNHHKNEKDYYYELKKWIPSKFLTHVFITFSPICLSFLIFMDVTFTSIFPLIINQFLFAMIIGRYIDRIRDDSILFESMLEEYYLKRVEPMIKVKYQNVMIDATPQGNKYFKPYPYSKSTRQLIFNRHNLDGSLIREKYNSQIEEFEEIKL